MGFKGKGGEDSNKGTTLEAEKRLSVGETLLRCCCTRNNERYPIDGILAKRIPVFGTAFTVLRSGWVGGVRPAKRGSGAHPDESRWGRGPR